MAPSYKLLMLMRLDEVEVNMQPFHLIRNVILKRDGRQAELKAALTRSLLVYTLKCVLY